MSRIDIVAPNRFSTLLEGDGYLRRTLMGGICLDACASDAAHLEAPTPPELDRRKCRTMLSDLIPETFLGRRGSLKITVEFDTSEKEPE